MRETEIGTGTGHGPSNDSRLDDSESEDVLHTVNPNQVFNESDSSASDSSNPTPCPTLATPTVYQVVYDISGMSEDQQRDIISIELGASIVPVCLNAFIKHRYWR
ncbi:hypothetical protein Baya_5435 [Bagarius yarrelli]|uniref:Uncharacterized protein n=1 Tax=Bagarius yarrelli TaxID=175774 RepID=A0A556TUN8_BAGYA|nr:hypothetical protein Baya_5435 [Bagarius yarrelli]